MFLGINIFWALLRAHFNPRLTAQAKMSLSRAQNIFMLANINSIVLIYRKWTPCRFTKAEHLVYTIVIGVDLEYSDVANERSCFVELKPFLFFRQHFESLFHTRHRSCLSTQVYTTGLRTALRYDSHFVKLALAWSIQGKNAKATLTKINGAQQHRNVPITKPIVLAAFRSLLNVLWRRWLSALAICVWSRVCRIATRNMLP